MIKPTQEYCCITINVHGSALWVCSTTSNGAVQSGIARDKGSRELMASYFICHFCSLAMGRILTIKFAQVTITFAE